MANKILHQAKGFSHRKVVKLFGFITTTTAGAIDSAASTNCNGFTVARTSAGLYRLTLENTYQSLIMAQAIANKASASWVAGKGVASLLSAFSMANGTVDIAFIDDTGVVDDVTDGSLIFFELTFADSLLSR